MKNQENIGEAITFDDLESITVAKRYIKKKLKDNELVKKNLGFWERIIKKYVW